MKFNIKRIKINSIIQFIDKLLSVDKFIYFKIKKLPNKNKAIVVSNCYLPEKDAVKIQQVNLEDIMEIDSIPDKNIKISFFDGSYVIEALKHFDQNVSGEIICKEICDDLVATVINLKSDNLDISVKCTDPSLGFQDLTAEQIKSIFNTDSALFSFNIDYFEIEDLKSLFKLEKEKDIFKICVSNAGISFKGDVYNKLINTEVKMDKEVEIIFYKKYLSLFDKESYNITVCPNKAILKSLDSNTMITIASCQSE